MQRGIVAGLTAYLIWGLFPLYWPLLEPAGALEILGHRMVWSLVVMAILVTGLRQWPAIVHMPLRVWGLVALAAAGLLLAFGSRQPSYGGKNLNEWLARREMTETRPGSSDPGGITARGKRVARAGSGREIARPPGHERGGRNSDAEAGFGT